MAERREQKPSRSTRKRRSTGSRGSLKRFATLDSVVVEEPFSLSLPKDAAQLAQSVSDFGNNENADDPLKAGDACYVSATVHNRRFYGLLVDQASLSAASLLYFHDEASSLDLNRRMKMLAAQRAEAETTQSVLGAEEYEKEEGEKSSAKRENSELNEENDSKRHKREQTENALSNPHPVQKFRYVLQQNSSTRGADLGYRVLLATYADVNAAAEDNPTKIQEIENACQSGGDFVGDYYYQYQVLDSSLVFSKPQKRTDVGFHTSMGFQNFLHNTNLPTWFPLSNLEGGHHKVLSILNMRKNSKGSVEWDPTAASNVSNDKEAPQGTAIPMKPRTCFRVGVVGAGIAGLATALELFQSAEKEKVDIEVTLFEGRSRIGGRVYTDETTFKLADGSAFPVDLGASWIHGIDHNPLATLAQEAGVDFVTASEDVKMFGSNMEGVDADVDENAGKLFDDLLDQAAEDCWDKQEYGANLVRYQKAVRWYASVLGGHSEAGSQANVEKYEVGGLVGTDAPQHRHSSDVSIDHAIGKVVSKSKKRDFSKLSTVENALLLWNTKNIEYALGANVLDLSMKYWDSDDRHAFEGDHVLLKQGYSTVVNHLMEKIKKCGGEKFTCCLDFAVGRIEYAHNSQSMPYLDQYRRSRKAIEISDKCCITSQDGLQKHYFDFVVCALPLGVLKESVKGQTAESSLSSGVVFEPPLPTSKVDSIQNVGFGLLNKVYLQFPVAFWRLVSALSEDQILFGNVSGLNPHHYMFFDIGKSLQGGDDPPAVLMTLISGREAVESELMTETELVEDVMDTLRNIFSNTTVPNPIASKTTRWGSEKFSRGCYTFLPPGATDQDFQILQSPVNGNGDSMLLESSETMRLFWAGEHTTALHPSMSHGALLSGIRAAREVIAAMHVDYAEYGWDRLIPMPIFRFNNPEIPLQCSLCHGVGSGVREGPLLAFQRGSRQVLVHNSCAEKSPEVEVRDGKWKHVIKAANRGKQIKCSMCRAMGATVGCSHETCFRSFHYTCGEDTGWDFEKDGKVFYCDLHRSLSFLRPSLRPDINPNHGSEYNTISIRFFRSKNPSTALQCAFCGATGDDDRRGKMLAFQRNMHHLIVHENCLRHTNVIETVIETNEDEDAEKFKNVSEALSLSGDCSKCGKKGASIRCSEAGCNRYFHYLCADIRKEEQYKCPEHGETSVKPATASDGNDNAPCGSLFQHALFFQGSNIATENGDTLNEPTKEFLPSNAESDNRRMLIHGMNGLKNASEASWVADSEISSDEESSDDIMSCRLSCSIQGEKTDSILMQRTSMREPWGVSFTVDVEDSTQRPYLFVGGGAVNGALRHGFKDRDCVLAMDRKKIGSDKLRCLRDVLLFLRHAVSVTVEVARATAH